MDKMKKLDVDAYEWFDDKNPNARDKSIFTLMFMVKDLIMVRMQMNKDKAEKWDDTFCSKPRAKLLKCVKDVCGCMSMKCDRSHFQVYSGATSNQCAVNLEKRQCSCRK
ncbi:hypothetical protein LIER_14331 [Lithospermum erythrorhizon]|uniref:Uncharacterized protein n=1 Tax=Lithospermum erythrorhizon TaxID=34254 RepID=A0AAV3Q216_LITER